tara:strand:- start:5880 stop:6680 length:801 start_codon:yes stop_codon:yes gene_type:complete
MSSIYRKNRDGYFYYQTYIYNQKTGKKDKRIFHALATKNRSEAETKQAYYDKKYRFLMNRKEGTIVRKLTWQYSKTFITVLLTASATIFLVKVFQDKPKNFTVGINSKASLPKDIINKQKDIFGNDLKHLDSNKTKNANIIDKKINIEKNAIERKIKVVLPKYKIIRVSQVSGAFGQGELHVIVSKPFNSKGLMRICENVSNRHSEFDNIIICLYLDDEIGRALASGTDNGITEKQKNDSWIAMYTFNPVEGKFFDDNPGGYLGSF